MSTKYRNVYVQAHHRAQAEGHPEQHCVLVRIEIRGAIPTFPGGEQIRPGQNYAHVFNFPDHDSAESARTMIEQVLDSMLPVAIQAGVLLPVEAAGPVIARAGRV